MFWCTGLLLLLVDATMAVSNTTERMNGIQEVQNERGLSRTTETMTITTTKTPTTNSKIIIDSVDDIRPIQLEDSVRSSVIFFSASLSIFTGVGIFIFFRKCVTCPARRHGRRRHLYPPTETITSAVVTATDPPLPKFPCDYPRRFSPSPHQSLDEICLQESNDVPV